MKQKFDVNSNSDCPFDNPQLYQFDPVTYDHLTKVASVFLESSTANMVEFTWVGEDSEAQFLNDEGQVVNLSEYECAWKGTHLRVYRNGCCQLYWESKHTDDEFWVEFELAKANSL
jgi:hypothetical protein